MTKNKALPAKPETIDIHINNDASPSKGSDCNGAAKENFEEKSVFPKENCNDETAQGSIEEQSTSVQDTESDEIADTSLDEEYPASEDEDTEINENSSPPSPIASENGKNQVYDMSELHLDHETLKSKQFEKFGEDRVDFAKKCSFPQTLLNPEDKLAGWAPSTAERFKLRIGPKYKKTKKKAPSQPALYDTRCTRSYRCKKRTSKTTNMDALPIPYTELFPDGTVPPLGAGLPQIVLLVFQLPSEQPYLLKKKTDGEGGEILFFMTPSDRFIKDVNDHLDDKNNLTDECAPATKLWWKWCNTAERSKEWSRRFKAMALLRNLEKSSVGKFLKPYNGKPVLIKESGRATRGVTEEGVRYLEFRTNIHEWGFVAKKGFIHILPKFGEMSLDVGFTIEGKEDEELPEVILNTTLVHCFDADELLYMPPELQEISP